ncbi:hypothetical protein NPIL_253731 [Nephila pilipes]|uniref:Uncharacterized protein n=1 Tax=Nephila pilipes TaxID=299642 RepID=A0A8X6MWR6_NEPPI|nr:hypothetical protein NPIL_253731 [Nephila pilipes]
MFYESRRVTATENHHEENRPKIGRQGASPACQTCQSHGKERSRREDVEFEKMLRGCPPHRRPGRASPVVESRPRYKVRPERSSSCSQML